MNLQIILFIHLSNELNYFTKNSELPTEKILLESRFWLDIFIKKNRKYTNKTLLALKIKRIFLPMFVLWHMERLVSWTTYGVYFFKNYGKIKNKGNSLAV